MNTNVSALAPFRSLVWARSYYVDTMLKCTGCFYYRSMWNSYESPILPCKLLIINGGAKRPNFKRYKNFLWTFWAVFSYLKAIFLKVVKTSETTKFKIWLRFFNCPFWPISANKRIFIEWFWGLFFFYYLCTIETITT